MHSNSAEFATRHLSSSSPDVVQVQVYGALEALLGGQRRMERELSSLAADQKAIAMVLTAWQQPTPPSRAGSKESSRGDERFSSQERALRSTTTLSSRVNSLGGIPLRSEMPLSSEFRPTTTSAGFMTGTMACSQESMRSAMKYAEVLTPAESKALLDAHPNAIFLDVSESTSLPITGTHRLPFEQLYSKVNKDPVLANANKEDPVLITCAMEGVARLASNILLAYGFCSVKILDGGNSAWNALINPTGLPPNWPASVLRRTSLLEDETSVVVPGNFRPSLYYARTKSSNMSFLRLPMDKLPVSQTQGEEHNWDSRFILAPNCKPRIVLDMLSIVVLIFDLITVPLYLAWDLQAVRWYQVSSLIVASFWALDIILTFRTGFFADGKVIMNPRSIAVRYFRSWFVPDLTLNMLDWAGQVSFLTGISSESNSRAFGILRFTKWSRFLRFFGMARFMRFTEVFQRVVDMAYKSPRFVVFLQVLRLLFAVLYLNHFGACLWWAVGNGWGFIESQPEHHWVYLPVEGALDRGTYIQASPIFQYTTSFHCAVSMILAGSLPIPATNSKEQLLSSMLLIGGLLALSSFFSTLVAKVTQLRMLQQDKRKKLEELRTFLRSKAVTTELGLTIVKQVDQSLSEERLCAMEDLAAWGAVSQRHRKLLHRELCWPYVLSFRFLSLIRDVEGKVVRQLCDTATRISIHARGDTIFAGGTPAPETYCAVTGSMKYTQEPESSMVTAEEEHFVTPLKWVCEAALWTQWTHTGTLEAITTSELLVLQGDMAADVLTRNHVAGYLAREYSRVFLARLQSAKPPLAPWPNDLFVPNASYEELVPAMTDHARIFISTKALQNSNVLRQSTSAKTIKLQEDVQDGRITLVKAPSGHMEMCSSRVVIHLELMDRVLVQLGTWEGENAIANCKLPSSGLLQEELPVQAFERILRLQLSLTPDAVFLHDCVRRVESTTAMHLVSSRTAITEHCAELNPRKWPLQMATAASNIHIEHMSHTRSLRSAENDVHTRSSDASMGMSPDEVFVVAGLPEDVDKEEDEAQAMRSDISRRESELVLRLFMWMDLEQYEFLVSPAGHGRLRKFLSQVCVTDEIALQARQLFYSTREQLQQCPTGSRESFRESWHSGQFRDDLTSQSMRIISHPDQRPIDI